MQPNEPEITNPKTVTDNSVILDAVETLLSSSGYDTNQLNVGLDAIRNAIKKRGVFFSRNFYKIYCCIVKISS